MRRLWQAVSGVSLAATIAPPLLFFADRMTLDAAKLWMLIATAAWFVATPLWMERSAED
jgi:hypothetical protein